MKLSFFSPPEDSFEIGWICHIWSQSILLKEVKEQFYNISFNGSGSRG